MNALVAKPPERMPLSYTEMERLAVSIAKSGLFGLNTPDKAMALMMIAHAEGRHPASAARDYDIINGKPAKKAEAMMRDFVEAGGKMKWHSLTDELADATFIHPQTGEVRIEWDMKRAAMAQLAGKENWKKYPRQMLRNRVVSEGIRTLWPLATSGMYVPDEVADFTGTTIDHEAEPEQPTLRDQINAEAPIRAAAAGMQRAPRVSEKTAAVYDTAGADDPGGWKEFAYKVHTSLGTVQSRAEVLAIGDRKAITQALEAPDAPPWLKRDLEAMFAAAYERFPQDELPEIVGEARLAAG